MTCPNCGHQNLADARFCAKCGLELAPSDHPSEPGQSPFKKAFLWTVIPVGGLSVASMMGGAGGDIIHDPNVLSFGYFLWYGAALGWIVGVLAAIGFALASKRQTASGILAGIGVGFVVLAVTCFANVFTLG